MKILWIVNTIFGYASEKLFNKKNGGLWMEAMLDEFKNDETSQIYIATTAPVKNRLTVSDKNICYNILPSQYPALYNENKKKNIKVWDSFLKETNPDLIVLWGTEFTHGLCALRLAKHIPSLVYVQGITSSIAMHYLAGMTHREIVKNRTFRDFLKHDSIYDQQKKFLLQSEKEREIYSLSNGAIVENEWAKLFIKSQCEDIRFFHCPLNINNVFSNYRWNIKKAEPHSIMCTASGYPLKGLHQVIKAVAILKKKYNDVKLYVPGDKMVSDGTLKGFIKKDGYTKYIEKLIKEQGVENNIVWLGRLPQKELAEQLSKVRVFVLSSSIENHSSSLKEAMMVGTPSVATSVGGVPEYVTHGENGYLYNFAEYNVLAEHIDSLFNDDEKSTEISKNARESMLKLHSSNDIFEKMLKIYSQVIEENK